MFIHSNEMKLSKGDILFNIGFWLFIWAIFFFSLLSQTSFEEALFISSIVVLPLIIPVYIHNYLFDHFIIRKQYVLYFTTTAIVVVFFGYLIDQLQEFLEPEGESETYGALLFFMIFYTGAKYARIGTKQQIRIKEEESKRIKAEIELKEMEAKQAHAELDLLKSQINPHFLFNSLNSIYSLILDNSNIASDAVLKLSDLMRYLLESSKKRKVLVKHEIQFLENYIELEKIRLGKKAAVEYKIEGDYHGKIISPMLIIPFIENCFKHGISTLTSENKINISIQLIENNLIVKTQNNIAPKRISSNEKQVKTGIENVKRRLNLLYNNRHLLQIHVNDKEYQVDLKIEL